MKKILSFLKNIHSTGTSESAKRFYGAIGFISSIIFIAIWDHSLILSLLLVSTALLGLETIFNIFKK